MDFLRRTYTQLHERFRSMTPGGRLMATLLAAAVVIGLVCLGIEPRAEPDTDLMHGVPIAKSRLPRMEAAFGKAKLKDFIIRGSSILVPHGQETKYMQALEAANALPPALGRARREIIDSGSIWEIGSRREQQRIDIAKQEAVADAIRSRPGIEDASVIYDEKKTNGFQEKTAKAIAYVWPVGSKQLDEATVIDIRNDVVGAYSELKPEDVTVSDLNGHSWRGGVGSADELKYRNVKRSCEQPLKAKTADAETAATPAAAPRFDASEVWNWAVRSWKTLAWIGFGVMCLLVLRSLTWRKSAATSKSEAARVKPAAAPLPRKTAAAPPPHWRRDVGVTDRSLREELSELVEKDPEAAAGILRSWIGQVN